ncbi:hypothetical protein CTAYLR_004781 [Chrysophaeum taylorii]|uniref:Uncharacterized protein n=1 Tax=Chrysophaeum taylorii TaxID=2483200 RepID=A0AAD7UNJ4_9STRA|nr:hypothetical protein CTAYLR_004781 [Chrysophaeum taylorii]
MDDLTKTKLEKLEEQKKISDRLNDVLNREGGLVQTSDRVCKNLVAAVAVSKRPGFFEYFQPSDAVQRIYQTGECGALVRKIARTQQEIDAIDRELAEKKAVAASNNAAIPPAVANLDQWFSSYGKPKEAPAPGVMTSFHKETKIYGATSHHRAFKSQALTMKKGRITN